MAYGTLLPLLLLALVVSSCGYDRQASSDLQDFETRESWQTQHQRIARPAVVKISTQHEEINVKGQNEIKQSHGTAFVIDPRGYMITASHVADPTKHTSITAKFSDGSAYDVTVIANYPDKDAALLKVDFEKMRKQHFLSMADPEKIEQQAGAEIMGLGFPLEYDDYDVINGNIRGFGTDVTVSSGRVIKNVIRTTLAVNGGNSGGPVLEPSGHVIGLIMAFRQGANDISFVIPIWPVRELLADALKLSLSKRVQHHGMKIRKLPVGDRVTNDGMYHVDEVADGTPGAKAGFAAGDLIEVADDSPRIFDELGSQIEMWELFGTSHYIKAHRRLDNGMYREYETKYFAPRAKPPAELLIPDGMVPVPPPEGK